MRNIGYEAAHFLVDNEIPKSKIKEDTMADNSGVNKLKGTTPSKLVQGVVDQSWTGGVQSGNTNPQQVLNDKFTAPKNQVKTGK